MPKKSKKEVLIISVSLVALAFIVLVIFGIVRYGYHVWACKKESNHGNNVLSEDVLYDHLLMQNLRK